MRAVGVAEFGGPERLEVFEVPQPEPGPGQVRIRVHAAAVSPTDTLFRAGAQADRMRRTEPPFVPGMDAAGVIDAIGPDNDDRLAVGDRVVAMVLPTSRAGGAYAEQIVLPAACVVRAPAGVDLAAASTLIMNAATARLTLDALALAPGQVLAVTGAAGAYGAYVVQLAIAEGLRVIADAAPKDEALVRSLGATEIVARGDDVAAGIRALVPQGVDGLADGSIQGALVVPALADGGGMAVVRGWNGEPGRGITVHPILVSTAAKDTAMLTRLVEQVEDGTLTLRVADVLPADQAAEAHRRLEAGGVRGRLVLDFT
ncbi:MAG: NADP-dependent oxidoreductase [Candidatus Nanopelagicales bacterium]|nr:NADP-dependent oxidoreductase [Candidatus Nanopelagicales bacterium]